MTDVTQVVAELTAKVAVLDQKLDTIAQRTDESSRSNSKLVEELHNLTGAIREMVVKQDHARDSADRMWRQHEDLSLRVRSLESVQAANAPVIAGVRDLNKKIVGMVMAALLAAVIAPFATVTYVIKQLPEQAVTRNESSTQTPRNTEQQPRQY
jgi:uncharacterized coiled-coil DUF342 family protein